jgi:hypothetical protein
MTAEASHTPAAERRAEGSQRWALRLLWWIPLSPFVGFVIAGRWLSASWPIWQVALMAMVLAAPFGAGAYLALRAVHLGGTSRCIAVALLHGLFMVLAVVLPVSESLAGP